MSIALQSGARGNGRPRGYKGIAMEGFIARWYARNTAKQAHEFEKLAHELAGKLKGGGSILEVAPGPGYLAIELARRGAYQITGLDISHSFVEMANENARRAGVAIAFRQGDAASMPFEAETFDLIVCRAAFKNFTRPIEAIREMHRVLRPGGQALIIDLRSDASADEIDAYVRGMRLGVINSLITKLTFKHMLLKRLLEGTVRADGFADPLQGVRLSGRRHRSGGVPYKMIWHQISVRSASDADVPRHK
jgi:ubiquinone/menaquinone biosynthesis C-methylase UbiE